MTTLRIFILRMVFFVLILSLIFGSISWYGSGRIILGDWLNSFVFIACCAFFCSLFLYTVYDTIAAWIRPLFFLSFLCIVAVGVLLGVMCGFLILTGRFRWDKNLLLISFIFGLLSSSAVSTYMVLQTRLQERAARLRDAELKNEQLKRLETEARLSSLQAKLNPHFLFNTLNSIAALIHNNAPLAERGIELLSDLYRQVLAVSGRTFIPLEDELSLIRDYLELERLRFPGIRYSVDCPEELMSRSIPGLILEPVVGNAVKHGIGRGKNELNLRIRFQGKDGGLRISIEDDGVGFSGEPASGFGLAGLGERLSLLYGESAVLEIQSNPGQGTTVLLEIPGPDRNEVDGKEEHGSSRADRGR